MQPAGTSRLRSSTATWPWKVLVTLSIATAAMCLLGEAVPPSPLSPSGGRGGRGAPAPFVCYSQSTVYPCNDASCDSPDVSACPASRRPSGGGGASLTGPFFSPEAHRRVGTRDATVAGLPPRPPTRRRGVRRG